MFCKNTKLILDLKPGGLSFIKVIFNVQARWYAYVKWAPEKQMYLSVGAVSQSHSETLPEKGW